MLQLLPILLLLPILCCSPGNEKKERNCRQFRTGTFIQYDHELNLKYKFIRTDSLQTEINLSENTRNISKIVWRNDCEYDLFKVSSDKAFPKADSLRGKKPIHISIIETTDRYYIFTARLEGFGRSYTDTAFLEK